MAQEIQQWRPSTELSVMQRADLAKRMLAQPTSTAEAAKHGKLLIGQWPYLKPPNPEAYSLSVARTFEQYPLGIVQECCDPQIGLAKHRELAPTVAAITQWCDQRLLQHRGAIRWAEQAQQDEADERRFTAEHRKSMLERWRALLHTLLAKSPQNIDAAG